MFSLRSWILVFFLVLGVPVFATGGGSGGITILPVAQSATTSQVGGPSILQAPVTSVHNVQNYQVQGVTAFLPSAVGVTTTMVMLPGMQAPAATISGGSVVSMGGPDLKALRDAGVTEISLKVVSSRGDLIDIQIDMTSADVAVVTVVSEFAD